MSGDNRSGTCSTGKVRYENEADAAEALARVRAARAERPDGKPPERIFYKCRYGCEGYHLSSRLPDFEIEEPAAKGDGETWQEYAHRLERRIFDQRQHIESIHALREEGNRHARKKIEGLVAALGRMTARWEKEREQRRGLIEHLRSRETQDVDAALDLLARVPYESGSEIADLIEERRSRAAS